MLEETKPESVQWSRTLNTVGSHADLEGLLSQTATLLALILPKTIKTKNISDFHQSVHLTHLLCIFDDRRKVLYHQLQLRILLGYNQTLGADTPTNVNNSSIGNHGPVKAYDDSQSMVEMMESRIIIPSSICRGLNIFFPPSKATPNVRRLSSFSGSSNHWNTPSFVLNAMLNAVLAGSSDMEYPGCVTHSAINAEVLRTSLVLHIVSEQS